MATKGNGKMTGKPVTYKAPSPAGGVQLETFIPWTLVKRRVRREIIKPLDAPGEFKAEAAQERCERLAAQDTPLVRALVHQHEALAGDPAQRLNRPAVVCDVRAGGPYRTLRPLLQ